MQIQKKKYGKKKKPANEKDFRKERVSFESEETLIIDMLRKIQTKELVFFLQNWKDKIKK